MNRLSKVLRLTALSAALISSAAFADSSRQDDDRYGQYRQDGDDDRSERDARTERHHRDRDDDDRNGNRHEDRDSRYGQYGGRDQAQYPRYGDDASRDRDYRSREEGRYRYEVYASGGQRDQSGRDSRYADYNRAYYGYDNPRYDRFDYRAARNWSRQNNYYGFKQLPPGIRMNMARGMRVPYGISYRRLPPQYLSYLPRYRGYEWRGYGNDLVLVGTRNWIIAEVIRGALG